MKNQPSLINMCIAAILCGLLSCGTNNESDETSETFMDNMTIFTFPATTEELCKDFSNDIDLAVEKFDGSKIALSGFVESTQNEQENDCSHIIMSCGDSASYKVKICLDKNLLPSDTIQAGKYINVMVKYLTHTSNMILLKQVDEK
jgi:hypothetical protein